MRNDDLKLVIIMFVIGIAFCSLICWISGNAQGEYQTLKEALPVCTHATVGHAYGNYVCKGEYKYSYKRNQ